MKAKEAEYYSIDGLSYRYWSKYGRWKGWYPDDRQNDQARL